MTLLAGRESAARALVRWVSRWMDASYAAYVRFDGDTRWSRAWAAGARRAQRVAFPLARKLDHVAMSEQMAEECWWG